MFKKAVSIFALCLSISISSYASDPQNVIPIVLSKADDVVDAKTISDAIDGQKSKVMACVKNKNIKPNECYCSYPREISLLQNAYEKAIKAHPTWKDQVLFWQDKKSDDSNNLYLKAIRLQLEKKCPSYPSSETGENKHL